MKNLIFLVTVKMCPRQINFILLSIKDPKGALIKDQKGSLIIDPNSSLIKNLYFFRIVATVNTIGGNLCYESIIENLLPKSYKF